MRVSRWLSQIGGQDATMRRLMEDILAVEEEHADDMAGLPEGYQ